jgi:hypothetical protein
MIAVLQDVGYHQCVSDVQVYKRKLEVAYDDLSKIGQRDLKRVASELRIINYSRLGPRLLSAVQAKWREERPSDRKIVLDPKP